MKDVSLGKILCGLSVVLLFEACAGPVPTKQDYPVEAVAFPRVDITDEFWAPRIEINRTVSIPYLLRMSAEKGSLLEVEPTFKTMEAAAYTLVKNPDLGLEASLDRLADMIIEALIPAGHEKIWDDASWDRDLYPAGHFIEAAIAHHLATGKRKMLDAALKIADHLVSVYGPDKKRFVPSHEEIEIALVRLYRLSGEEKYLKLAEFFLDERGRESHAKLGEYAQDHKPVIEQSEAVGHCVMATYLYGAMTDAAALTGNAAYIQALDKIWQDMVFKKTAVSGGIGAVRFHEQFGSAYELPNLSAWNETCGAYGSLMWNDRLFRLTGEAKYADLVERILYNGFLVGVSLKGDRFFYQNPLKSFGSYERFDWINVPCCPPNVARLLATLGNHIYAKTDSEIYVNLFIGSSAEVEMGKKTVKISQETRYPWEGGIRMTVDPGGRARFTVCVRIPGWAMNRPLPGDLYRYMDSMAEKPDLKVNGRPVEMSPEKGYIRLKRTWKKGDVIELHLPLPVRRVLAHEAVREDRGLTALERGPLVYCAEWPDNGGSALNLFITDDAALDSEFRPSLLDGVQIITGQIRAAVRGKDGRSVETVPHSLVAIPYFAWANRGMGEMAVWLPRQSDKARLKPVLPSSLASVTAFGAKEKQWTGYNDQSDDISAVYDGVEPLSSADESHLYFRMTPAAGKPAWIEYEFRELTEVSSAEVYFVDDRRFCRLPASWRILYKEGNVWKPVDNSDPYGVEKDKFNRVTFAPFKAKAVRIEVEPQKIFYKAGGIGPPAAMIIPEDTEWRESGIIEWRVGSDSPGGKTP